MRGRHVTKKNEHKLVQVCDSSLTATGVVSLVITDLGVFEPTGTASASSSSRRA